MSLHKQKDHYAAIEDVHVNLENRNHAFDEYGYGPLNPKESNDDFWKQKAKVFNTTPEEAKKSRCGNCAAFNQSKEIMNRISDGLGPVGHVVAEKADLGFCEMFKFKCAAERTCDAWLVNGPITEEMNVGAIAGTGDTRLPPDQREPGRPPEFMPMQRRKTRKGKFMNKETFIVPHSTFVSLREAKKKHKHWKTYLNEDDAYYDIREYAKAHKGPIIVEDENTGAMMYIRYGEGALYEAWTNRVERSGSRWLSSAGENIRGLEVLRGAKKIGNYNKTHSVYTHTVYTDDGPSRNYHLVHNETGHITHSVNGPMKKGVLEVNGAGASEENKKLGTKIKMEDFYHHLLKRGARHEASGSKEPNQHPVALVGTSHSGPSEDEEGDYGAQKVWRNLAKKPKVNLNGFIGGKKGRAINIGKAEDPSEIYADPHDYSDRTGKPSKGEDPERTQVGKMSLVASVAVPKKKKFRYKIRRKRR